LAPAQASNTVLVPAAQTPAPSLDKPIHSVPPLSALTSGGSIIDSYSMSLAVLAEGKDGKGSSYKQDFTFAEDSIKSQKADHLKISGMSALLGLASGDLDIYQLNTSLYLYSAAQKGENASCLSLGSGATAFDPNIMNPGSMMKDITVDKLLDSGMMVNGVKTDHYSLKNSDLGFGKAASQSGEVWLAQDGGYVVKFSGQAEGTFDVVTSFTGTINWTYDVTNINLLTGIVLPEECSSQQTSLSDLVFPPNATGQSQLGQMTIFSSPDKPAAVSTFFQKNLPDKGWKIDSVEESHGSVITLQISKIGQKMQITITGEGSTASTNVIISPVH
jgi:hypothetical protein